LPEKNVQILHNNCPKKSFHNFRRARALGTRARLLRLLGVFYAYADFCQPTSVRGKLRTDVIFTKYSVRHRQRGQVRKWLCRGARVVIKNVSDVLVLFVLYSRFGIGFKNSERMAGAQSVLDYIPVAGTSSWKFL